MHIRPLAGLLLCATSIVSCRSAEDYRADADREAYELVQSRRTKLQLDSGAFSIEPEADSLRQRLITGEARLETPLSLVEVLQIAAANSRTYQAQKERLYMAALDLTLERWRFAIQKGGTLNALLEGTGDTAETASADADFSLSKILGTGATIIGSLGLNLTRSLISSDDWNPSTELGLQFSQPLLAGFGERIVMEPLTQAERDLVYAVREFERFRRTFGFDVASRYYRLLQLEDEVKNQEENVANLEELSARNRALAEAGRLSAIEFGQARQNELRSNNDLLSARQRYDDARDAFKFFLGLPVQAEVPIDQAALAALEADKDARIDYDEDVATRFALAHRLDHQTALDQVDDADRHVYVAEDNLRAVLTFDASANLKSGDDNPFSFDPSDATWDVGATYRFPFERLPQRNAYRNAIIQREDAVRSSSASEDQIRLDLRGDLRTAVARRESYVIQVNALTVAEKRVESISMLRDAGRADTRDLLEAQASLLEAQNAVTSALIEYTLARLNLFLDMELLYLEPTGLRLDTASLEAAEAAAAAAAAAAEAHS
jgi:outer membrane protein TolC